MGFVGYVFGAWVGLSLVFCLVFMPLLLAWDSWQFRRDQKRLATEWQQREHLEACWVLPTYDKHGRTR